MRISDWSSDVCSSDLQHHRRGHHGPATACRGGDLEAVAGVPHQMPDAVAEMIEERIAPAEQQQPPDQRSDEALRGGEGVWPGGGCCQPVGQQRSEEHTSELQSLMRISYADF